MAITWDVQISNVNLISKRGTVTATRTDSESALEPRTYTMSNTTLETPADRLLVLNTLKEWETTETDKIASVETFLDTLVQTAKTNLETWELTR